MQTHIAHLSPIADDADRSTASHPVAEFLTTRFARLAFALPFAVFGLFHFMNAQAMAGMVPVPGGVFWVYVTGAALIAGSVGIVTGVLGRWAAFGLAALMLTFVVFVHARGLGNAAMRPMAMMGLLKDISLMGGALTWAGLLKNGRAARTAR